MIEFIAEISAIATVGSLSECRRGVAEKLIEYGEHSAKLSMSMRSCSVRMRFVRCKEFMQLFVDLGMWL
jgi:hypothetical protein